jgi:hypothetical protein
MSLYAIIFSFSSLDAECGENNAYVRKTSAFTVPTSDHNVVGTETS